MKNALTLFSLMFVLVSCSYSQKVSEDQKKMRTEINNANSDNTKKASNMSSPIKTFLTFQEANAEEAMNFYIELFDNSEIIDIQKYGKDSPAPEGTIMVATFRLDGKEIMCSDSPIKHAWDFTPGVSLFVDCKSAEQQEMLFNRLSENGQVMMPLNNYGFSQRFGFVEDRFGVSWQLNLP